MLAARPLTTNAGLGIDHGFCVEKKTAVGALQPGQFPARRYHGAAVYVYSVTPLTQISNARPLVSLRSRPRPALIDQREKGGYHPKCGQKTGVHFSRSVFSQESENGG